MADTSERRMSDIEALMWNLEKDPHLSSTFANVTIFDRPVDFDRFRNRMRRVVGEVPRLRQRVVSSLGRLTPPEWQEDPELDIDFHIRRVALPQPGSRAELFHMAAVLVQTPFDRTRPLWEFVVVDGLADGRGAMVQKLHHTITDGEGGLRMSMKYIDLERDVVEPDAPEPSEFGSDRPPPRSLVDSAADVVTHTIRRQAGLARRGVEEAFDTARHPTRLTRLPGEVTAMATSLGRQVVVTGQQYSPLWTERSLRRGLDALRVPLDDAKRVSKELGGSINDLFVTGVAGGAGAYHRELGAPVDELRMAMPISTRAKGERGGNHFAPSRVVVPVGADPVLRFREVQARLAVTKSERSLGHIQVMAGLVNVLPTSMLVFTARSQVQTVDFTTSNVRGAPFPVYIAGAQIDENYPIGPLGGTACNVTTLSYNGFLDIGVHVDTAAVTQQELLTRCLRDSFAELLSLA